MFVQIHGAPHRYVRIVESYRDAEGRTQKRVVRNLGRLDALLQKDPLAVEKLKQELAGARRNRRQLDEQSRLGGLEELLERISSRSAFPGIFPEFHYGHYVLRSLWNGALALPEKIRTLKDVIQPTPAFQKAIFLLICDLALGKQTKAMFRAEPSNTWLGFLQVPADAQTRRDVLEFLGRHQHALFQWISRKLALSTEAAVWIRNASGLLRASSTDRLVALVDDRGFQLGFEVSTGKQFAQSPSDVERLLKGHFQDFSSFRQLPGDGSGWYFKLLDRVSLREVLPQASFNTGLLVRNPTGAEETAAMHRQAMEMLSMNALEAPLQQPQASSLHRHQGLSFWLCNAERSKAATKEDIARICRLWEPLYWHASSMMRRLIHHSEDDDHPVLEQGLIAASLLAALMLRLLQQKSEQRGVRLPLEAIVQGLSEARVLAVKIPSRDSASENEQVLFLRITSAESDRFENSQELSEQSLLMQAVGLSEPPRISRLAELASSLGTRFNSPTDAVGGKLWLRM